MAKFNRFGSGPAASGGIVTTARKQMPTHQGGAGWARDLKSELFLLAVSNLGGDTFYEDALGRDVRFRDLVRVVAARDSRWVANLALWLRRTCGMRSAPMVIAAEYAWLQRQQAGDPLERGVREVLGVSYEPPRYGAGFYAQPPTPRRLIADVCMRADEPGELLAYWLNAYGRPIPKGVTRGLGDAAVRLYSEYSVGSWDTGRSPVRYADVVELSQVRRGQVPVACELLFKFLLDDRRGRGSVEGLPQLSARKAILGAPEANRAALLTHPAFVARARAAGLSWEALSGWVPQMDVRAWEVASELMGYGGLLKNLNNFSRAGVSRETKERIAAKLVDPQAVAKSGRLPMAFLAAYLNVVDDFWKPLVAEALTASLRSIPALSGSSLILIDTSESMNMPYRPKNLRTAPGAQLLKRWDVAALFGLALAARCEKATVVSFSDSTKRFEPRVGENVLKSVERFRSTHMINGGTFTREAVERWAGGHGRLIVLTDEQVGSGLGNRSVWRPGFGWVHGSDVYASVPGNVPVHTFNLEGYAPASAPSGPLRFTIGGLSDAAFSMIGYLEAGSGRRWPWEAEE